MRRDIGSTADIWDSISPLYSCKYYAGEHQLDSNNIGKYMESGNLVV